MTETRTPPAQPDAPAIPATSCAPSEAAGASVTAACAPQMSQATHDFLKALANPGRQQIMLLFARGAELSVNQVAEHADISQSAASQQLALLRRGGIVTSRRDGKEVLYRGDRESTARILGDLQNYLRFCC
ncbi:metalloregulator ArsR/SmtB family transcription factor [Nonomuraea sp. NPDC026600]|uniref:ArsR/SmtB family transcription factor n=1 Tax=Nonomuraea sp. NPDC026600 TaxID=3155363 RepID=UPI0033CD7FCD